MFIEEIKIDGFGKFNSKSIKLNQGLNVIFGKNEDGKSTILNLIISLLYHKNIKEITKYIPWDRDSFGISNSIKVLLDNKQELLIEKNLNKKDIKVFLLKPFKDITSSFSINKNRINVMEDLTGLTLNSFESSALIRQSETRINMDNKDLLIEKLIRISKFGDEDIDYNNAIEKLDKRKDEIGTGTAGKHKELIKMNKKIEELDVEYKKATENIITVNQLQVKLSEINERLKLLYSNRDNNLKILEQNKNQLTAKYYSIEKELQDKEIKISETSNRIEDIYKKYKIDNLDIKKINKELNLINNLEERLSELINKKTKISNKIKEINEEEHITPNARMYDIKKSMLNDRLKAVKRYLTTVIIIGIISAIFATIFGIFYGSYNLLWYLMLAFIPITGVFIFFYKRNVNILIKAYEQEYKRIEFKTNITSEKEKSKIILDDIQNEIKYVQEKLIRKKRNNLVELKELGINTEVEEFKALLVKIIDSNRSLQELKNELQKLKSEEAILKNSIQAYKKSIRLEDREKKKLIEDNKLDISINLEAVEDDIKDIMENIKALEIEANIIEKEIEILTKNYTHPGDIKEEIIILNKQKEELEEEKECIDIAKRFLKSSMEEMQNSVVPILNEYSFDVIKSVLKERAINLSIDTELNMLLSNKDKKYINIQNLSYSTIEQIYLSLRIALTKILSDEERIPLFLDEPFAYYDDTRLENIIEYFISFSKERQIIMFTCQNRDIKVLKKLEEDFNLICL